MAAYPLTDALFPPAAVMAAAAAAPPPPQQPPPQAKTATATSIYDRLAQQPPPQSMLLQSLVTPSDQKYVPQLQQHQHHHHHHQHHQLHHQTQLQQQHLKPGTGPSSIRPAKVNNLSGVGLVVPPIPIPRTAPPSSLLRLPTPLDRRRQTPTVEAATNGNVDDAQAKVQNTSSTAAVVLGRHLYPKKDDLAKSTEPELPSAAASAAAAAAAYGRPQKMLMGPSNIPCQNSIKDNTIIVPTDINNYLLKSTPRREYPNAVANPIMCNGIDKQPTLTNGWSRVPTSRNLLPVVDDQPLDLTSVKKKRQQESGNGEDCPLDLSMKKRKMEVGYGGERHGSTVSTDQYFFYRRQDGGGTVASVVTQDVNTRVGLQRPYTDVYRQTGVFNQSPLLIPGVVGQRPEFRGRQVQASRHRMCTMPRLPYSTNGTFPLYQGRAPNAEVTPNHGEVPVIKNTNSFHLPSGSDSGASSCSSLSSFKSGSAGSINGDATKFEESGTVFPLEQRTLTVLQQQHQQQQTQQMLHSGACSINSRINIPNKIAEDLKPNLKEQSMIYSEVKRMTAVPELEAKFRDVQSSLLTASLPPHHQLQQQQQQQQHQRQCPYQGAKPPSVGLINCNDTQKTNANAMTSVVPLGQPGTTLRPNSRSSSHSKSRATRPGSSQNINQDSTGPNIKDPKSPRTDYLHNRDTEQLMAMPNREIRFGSMENVDLTLSKVEQKLNKPGISFHAETSEIDKNVLQSTLQEPPKSIASLRALDNESKCCHLSFPKPDENLTGVNQGKLKEEPIMMSSGTDDRKEEFDRMTFDRRSTEGFKSEDSTAAQSWTDDSKRTGSNQISAICTGSGKNSSPDAMSQPCVVNDGFEVSGVRNGMQRMEQNDVQSSETTTAAMLVPKFPGTLESLASKELDFSAAAIKQTNAVTNVPTHAEPRVQEDAAKRGGTCESCKWKDAETTRDQSLPTTTCSKNVSCRECESRDVTCSLTSSFSSQGDMMSRTCRGFDRQGTRRIPVANVQPFMKETQDIANRSSLYMIPKISDDTEKVIDDTTVNDTETKATVATHGGGLKDHLSLISSDTPHHMEFKRFLSMTVEAKGDDSVNPFRTPTEKLGSDGESRDPDCEERKRVRRQLLMHLAGPYKNRLKYSADSNKKEGCSVVFESTKKTPIEYIDEDNSNEPTQTKRKDLMSRLSKDRTKTATVAESSSTTDNDTIYKSSALYQTMKALEKQEENRMKVTSLSTSLSTSVSGDACTEMKSHAEGKPVQESENSTCDLYRASVQSLEPKKKKYKKKNENADVDETGRKLNEKISMANSSVLHRSNYVEKTEDDSLPASATNASSSTGSGEFASSSSWKPLVKRKYQRKKIKDNALAYPGSEGCSSVAESVANSTAIFKNSSDVSDLPLKRKRKRRLEAAETQNTSEPTLIGKDDGVDGCSNAGYDSVDAAADASSICQNAQFLHQTTTEAGPIRRRGMSTRREGIIRHARRCSYDRTALNEADLKPQDTDHHRLLRRGHGRGSRAAARHPSRLLGPHRLLDSNRMDTTFPSCSATTDHIDHYSHQHQQQILRLKTDDETTRDLFEYDDGSDPVYPGRRGQGRKPVRKNGRISFQYPEVFGRRRARGGLRGRARPVRLPPGSGESAMWNHNDLAVESFTADQAMTHWTPSDHYEDRNDPNIDRCSTLTPRHQVSVRGKVRSRVRVTGKSSRGHPCSRPSVDNLGGANQPCPSALGRDTSETRLHQVTRIGCEELVSYYLTTGIIHPNVQDNSGVTPLHDSCSHGYLNITRLLLDHGAHPNSKALDGTRPLHLAVANDHIEIVRLLLSYGADVMMTNGVGRSPLQMAKTREVKQLLKGYISDLSGGGKSKEIPWQFPTSFEVDVCDILADAPPDEQTEATEVTFDLGTDNPLPVHRFAPDSQKGPRNFHNVADICQDVKVEDFILLNGDLTFIHVSSTVTSSTNDDHHLPGSTIDQLPSTSSSSSSSSSSVPQGHFIPSTTQKSQRLCVGQQNSYVEIDANLKGLLEVSVHKLQPFTRLDSSISSGKKKYVDKRNMQQPQPQRQQPQRQQPQQQQQSVKASLSIFKDCGNNSISSSSLDLSSFTSELGNASELPVEATPCVDTINSNSLMTPEEEGSKDAEEKTVNGPSPIGAAASAHCVPLPPPVSASLVPSIEATVDVAGNCRKELESCRIVLCDINSQPLNDLNPGKCCARKESDRPTTMTATSTPVNSTGTQRANQIQSDELNRPEVTAGVKPSSDATSVETVIKGLTPTSNGLSDGHGSNIRGSVERNASSLQHHHRPSVSTDARRRATRETQDGAAASKPEVTQQQTESLIPVLEKHGSDDETPPVENDEDVCGERYDDEREMPQLTLYA